MRFDKLKRLVDPARPITYGIVQAGPEFDGGVPYIRPADMTDESGVKDFGSIKHTSPEIALQYRRSAVRSGDLIISIGPSFGKVMEVPSDLDGANLTQGTARVAPGPTLHARFAFWCLRSYHCYSQWEAGIGGATFRALNLGPLAETRIPNPDLATQRQIADFLDRETARIDLLIEKKQRLVALLGEKEAAFIESMVTNGFAFQPSRDQAIREDGWRLVKLKNLSSRLKVGVVVNPSEYIDDDGDIPFIYGGNIRDYYIDTANCRRMSADSSRRLKASRLRPSDVVVVRVGAPGVAAVIPDNVPEANCASVMCVTVKVCSGDWLAYAFNSRFVRYQVEIVQYGAAQKQFNLEHAREFTIPIPPRDQEATLVNQMRAYRDRNMKIKDTTLQSINRLKEYRSALITAAVTGQIDVTTYAKSGILDRQLDAIQEEMGA
ncbi:hypothetical protein B6V74_13015 [Thioclava sp. F42-5]|uniref:restriction endonuclease subunit S n=1 Tax=Thioclava sp. F42-5 TaxID=1973005 RepID=UPI000B53B916|nr:restriction endonuclease subunit S [Thioclava sp. F42-5]OWY08737.1 hypothetical protein B6V74_13015 [Thioclava sp. F42-5]